MGDAIVVVDEIDTFLRQTARSRYQWAVSSGYLDLAQGPYDPDWFEQLNQTPVPIWTSGLDNTCTFLNSLWRRITGYLSADGCDRWPDFIPPEDQGALWEAFMGGVARREPFRVRYRLRRPLGDYVLVDGYAQPVFRNGEYRGFVGSAQPITEAGVILHL